VRRGIVCAALAALGAMVASASAAAAVVTHGSADQVYATGLHPRAEARLLDRRGRTVATRAADGQGGVLLRKVAPGRGYRMRTGAGRSAPVTVFGGRDAPPTTRIYAQRLPTRGYGYLRTRDGTRLAIDVRLPAGPGPYPTLVEYSGYGYADPAGAESGISPIATLLGFAVVDVNMRGTGCSGGAYDFFERLQSLDGYDVVETVARQPWVLGHRVGMTGISFGGFSQLFVAATEPPHLAAITPLSDIDSTIPTLYPGGILNTGFALGWAKERAHDALPASASGGQPWALKRIRAGDRTCAANQTLHGEATNLIAMVRRNSHYVPAVADPLDPVTSVHRITAPTHLACQWEDEQTGGHCADLAQHFTGTRHAWFTFTNGAHVDSLDPATFNRWYDFLELYVAYRKPVLSASVRALVPTIYQATMGIAGVTLPPDSIQTQPSYAAARAAFERLPAIRVLFDNGAGSPVAGAPLPAFEQSFARFPIPGTRARSWFLSAGGGLAGSPPDRARADRFTWRPDAGSATSFTGPDDGAPGGLWTATPSYHWALNPPGTAASYATAPLTANATVIGGGAVHLWIKASAPSVDVQATVSELRPDGRETFVQNGWLRTDERKLDSAQSTLLQPVLSVRAADVGPLPRRRYTEVTVPLYFQGHVYRRHSRIRLTISAPGGDQPVWAFAETAPRRPATVRIAAGRSMPSRLILPVVPVAVPTGLPPCPGLRGEPCRAYRQALRGQHHARFGLGGATGGARGGRRSRATFLAAISFSR
jgi:predicted acyl esterase